MPLRSGLYLHRETPLGFSAPVPQPLPDPRPAEPAGCRWSGRWGSQGRSRVPGVPGGGWMDGWMDRRMDGWMIRCRGAAPGGTGMVGAGGLARFPLPQSSPWDPRCWTSRETAEGCVV